MSRANAPLIVFNRGRISKLGLARVDLDRTRLSAEIQTNFVPRVLGSMMLRPGTEYIGTINNSSTAIFIPFVKSNNDTALIELTAATRVWVPSTAVASGLDVLTRDGSTAVIAGGTFSSTTLSGWTDSDESGATSEWFTGNYMSLVGTRYARAIRRQTVTSSAGTLGLKTIVNRGRVTFKVGSSAAGDDYFSEAILRPGIYSFAIASTGNFSIELSANSEYRSLVESVAIESSGDMSLASTWASSDLSILRWDQSADVIFVDAFDYPQKRIERYSTDSWGMAEYDPQDGPFRNPNTTNKRLTPSGLSGDITLACDQPLFNSNHVGALFRITSIGQSVAVTPSGTDQWSDPIRVSGVDETRIFDILIGSTFDATMRVQRSIGEVGSFVDVSGLSWTSTIATSHDDGLDNQIVFYRVGVGSTFVSGAEATLTYASGGITGVAKINAVSASTESSARVLSNLGSTQATELWEEGDWSTFRGFPSAVKLHEGRLWQAGKAKIWGSVSDAYESFGPAVTGDSGVINRSIGTGPVDEIQWIESMGRLIVGTDDRELQAKTSSLEEPLTPTNFSLRDVSSQGSAGIQAVKLDKRLLFAQKAGVRVMETGYNGQTLDYETGDRSQLIPEIGEPGLSRMVVQRQPDTRVHCVRGATDGTVGLLVSDPAENVAAWVDIESSGGVNGIIEEGVVLPSPGEDAVYYAIKREINGSTVRYLERWSQEWDARGDGRGARGYFQITGGSAGSANQITSITVDGDEILAAPATWATSNEVTAEWVTTIIGIYIKLPPGPSIKSKDISAENTLPVGLSFSSDGTKMYSNKSGSTNKLFEYDLSTPGDTDTAVHNGVVFDYGATSGFESEKVSGGDGVTITGFDDVAGHTWNSDGTKLYFCENSYSTIYEVSLSTAWDLTSAVHNYGTRYRAGVVPWSMNFNDDGTRMYIFDNNTDITQHTLSTAYQIISASSDGVTFDPADASLGDFTSGNSAFFAANGYQFFVVDQAALNADAIWQYTMTERWNLSTAGYDQRSFNVGDQDTSPMVIFIDTAGNNLYMAGRDTDTVYQYSFPVKRYSAIAAGNTVEIVATPGSGSDGNGKEVIITTTGDMAVDGNAFTLFGGYSNIGISGRVARNRMADSHVTSDSSDPTTSVTGGEHLVGASVVLWGNGKDLGIYTVSSTGTFTASEASTGFVFGLPYSGIYKSAKLAYAAEAGTALTQKKKVNHVGLVLADVHPQGLQFGQSTDRLDPMPLVEKGAVISTDDMNQTYDEASIEFPGEWDTDSRIVLLAQAPRPVTVLGAVIQMETKEKT